jgi:tetratricopeptide (TPR) repeat protein
VLAAQGKTDEAVAEFETAVAAYRELSARDAANANWRRELAAGQYVLASAYLAQDRHAAALPLLRDAVLISQALTDADPTDASRQRDLAEQRRALGAALLAGGDPAAAALEAAAVISAMTSLMQASANDIHAGRIVSTAHALLARTWTSRGDDDKARHEWELAHAAIAAAASATNDYRFLDPMAVSLLHLDRAADAAPIVQKLSAMGYREPVFARTVASRGWTPPPRARQSGG